MPKRGDMRYAYLDGRFVEESDPAVQRFKEYLAAGPGVFETMRVIHGCVYLLDRHMKRLSRSSPFVGRSSIAKTKVAAAVKELVRRHGLENGALRLTVGSRKGRAGILIVERPLPGEAFSKTGAGLSAVFFSSGRMERRPRPCLKTTARDFYHRVGLFARSRGADEAFFMNARGELVEGSRTNVFFVEDGCVVTPSLNSGCLAGITRRRVLELGRRLRLRCRQRAVAPEELFAAEEIFVTNALIGIVPVVTYEGKPVCTGEAPMVSRLIKVYQNDIEKACRIG